MCITGGAAVNAHVVHDQVLKDYGPHLRYRDLFANISPPRSYGRVRHCPLTFHSSSHCVPFIAQLMEAPTSPAKS